MFWTLNDVREKMDELMFCIGNDVIIKESGQCFDHHRELAEIIIPENYKWVEGATLKEGTKVKLINVGFHLCGKGPEYLLDCVVGFENKALVYSYEGIEIMGDMEC
jgi:hypothetical protein